ncbi:MAG: DUF255 domain-containing protein [Fimbriimonadales bacterium]|nr:MAG: hypothetical protein KatS3mg018_2446 [Fimbriimonadales bacterium]
MSGLTPEYRLTAERYAPRFVVLSGVCLLMVLLAWLGIALRGLEREQHPNALKDAPEAYLRSGQYQLVNWLPCSEEAFARAKQRDRLVLIELGAYWSGRCQRLGSEAFSDSGVADLINREFVAVKLDADAMPKRARYLRQLAQLMGAPDRYPIIAWFTPDGKPIRVVAPDTRAALMRPLEELSQMYRTRPEQIQQMAEQLTRAWNERWARPARAATVADAPEAFLNALPAMPAEPDSAPPVFDLNHLEALLALAERGNPRAQEGLLAQLRALRNSPYWDAERKTVHALRDGIDAEGKPTGGARLMEHARLLSLYSRAARLDPELGGVAHELADGLRTQFYRERPAGFIAALAPPKLRIPIAQSKGLPQADRTLPVDANACAILALADYAATFGTLDPQAQWARETAPRVLETLRALRTLQGDLFHSSLRTTRDWMPDMALVVRAAVRVHRLQPNPRALQFAEQLLQRIWREYADPTGGFYDSSQSKQWGDFKTVPVRTSIDDGDLPADNALLALAMAEYAQASGDSRWRTRAQQLLPIVGGDYDPANLLAFAGYTQALARIQLQP